MTEEYLRGIRDTWFWVVVLAVLVLLIYIIVSGIRRRRAPGDYPVAATTQTLATLEASRRKEDTDKLLESVEGLNRAAINFTKATDNVLLFLSEERAARQQALAVMEREGLKA